MTTRHNSPIPNTNLPPVSRSAQRDSETQASAAPISTTGPRTAKTTLPPLSQAHWARWWVRTALTTRIALRVILSELVVRIWRNSTLRKSWPMLMAIRTFPDLALMSTSMDLAAHHTMKPLVSLWGRSSTWTNCIWTSLRNCLDLVSTSTLIALVPTFPAQWSPHPTSILSLRPVIVSAPDNSTSPLPAAMRLKTRSTTTIIQWDTMWVPPSSASTRWVSWTLSGRTVARSKRRHRAQDPDTMPGSPISKASKRSSTWLKYSPRR